MQSFHIHLYGPPAVGKSTLAAALYADLKIRGINAELVQEYAKELVWAREMRPERQLQVTAEQLRREENLEGKVRVIVTDSPPLLGVVYGMPNVRDALKASVQALTEHWTSISWLLERDLKSQAFEQEGRLHSREQSLGKAVEIRDLLLECSVPFETLRMNGNPAQNWDLASALADHIEARIVSGPQVASATLLAPALHQ